MLIAGRFNFKSNTAAAVGLESRNAASAAVFRLFFILFFDNLHGHDLGKAVEAFTKALYIAVPSARQTTQAGMLPWAYARVQIRKGQGMQVSFERPVTAKEGYLEPSIMRLDEVLARQEKLSGSLYGKIENQDYVFGADEKNSMSARNVNIDELAAGLAEYVKEFEAAE